MIGAILRERFTAVEIPIFNWFEEPIKSSFKAVFEGANSGIESLDLLKKYRKIHFEILGGQVSGIKILGMQQPMELKDLYYPARVSTDISRRIYDPEWKLLNGEEVSSKVKKTKATEAADAFIAKHGRVVILGGPGAGKTTLLKFLALAYSDKSVFDKTTLERSYLPVYVHLPQLAREGVDVIDHIAGPLCKRTNSHGIGFYVRLLELGACTVFFDSLDEVPRDLRKALITNLKDFCKIYPKARVVISCRTADYEQVFESFVEAELARLTKEGVSSVIKAWFGKDTDNALKLLNVLSKDSAVASLTETPLLLCLLCIQFRNDLALPKKRTELYRRCVDALLRDWDTTRGFRRDSSYAQLSDDRKERVFEALAGSLCKGSIQYEFSEAHVLESISSEIARFSLEQNDAKGILVEIENHHGIVEKCSAETYQFSHGSMQEYFAARHFVAKRVEMEVLKRKYEDGAWQNIISFMASMLDDPTDLLRFLVEKSSMERFQNYPAFGRRLSHLLLLYRCLTMGVAISPEIRRAICLHLVNSQVSMLKQLHEDGVVPYAARRPNGVRQPLFTYAKSRASIAKVLLPHRSLMNEMVTSPVAEYADCVVEVVETIEVKQGASLYKDLGLATSLLAPISDLKPRYFLIKMLEYSGLLLRLKSEGVRSVIVESITIHKARHEAVFQDLESEQ